MEITLNLLGKFLRNFILSKEKKEERIEDPEKSYDEGIILGDMVIFCSNPPEDIDHCNIWQWSVGLVVDVNKETRDVHILSEGKVHVVKDEWVGPLNMLARFE